MSDIADVIGWKFPGQEHTETRGGVITKFPGGIPSQADQDTWTAEYEARPPEVSPDDALDAAILAANNFGELKTALLGRTRGRK